MNENDRNLCDIGYNVSGFNHLYIGNWEKSSVAGINSAAGMQKEKNVKCDVLLKLGSHEPNPVPGE